jgi:hypothetical protein
MLTTAELDPCAFNSTPPARTCCPQVWENGTQWKGFLVCCEKLADHGAPLVLLQLPESILEKALDSLPRSLWKKVHDVAHALNCPVVVYKGVRQVVDKFHEKWMRAEIEHKQAELAARQAAAAAAAAGGSGGSGAGSGGTGGSGGKTGRVSTGGGAGAQQGAGAKAKGRPSSATAASKAPSEAAAATAAAGATGSVDADGSKPASNTEEQQTAAAAAEAQSAAAAAEALSAAAAAAAEQGQPAQQAPPPGAHTNDAKDDEDGDFVLDFEDDDDE